MDKVLERHVSRFKYRVRYSELISGFLSDDKIMSDVAKLVFGFLLIFLSSLAVRKNNTFLV